MFQVFMDIDESKVRYQAVLGVDVQICLQEEGSHDAGILVAKLSPDIFF